ncbi:MAG: hypothetical protein HRT89_07935, partial [Lentisphaeria bacterium]|nr:hypothetical protein [Lentisphaeria bacterium]NQZ67984.1 hypothetical protein [Lentisphaeria bacterium]
MKHIYALLFFALTASTFAQSVKLNATADIWLSDANNQERASSSGLLDRMKIKTIQEMGAIRFDVGPAKGKTVKKATLFLHLAGKDKLRHIRVSTISQTWVEGKTKKGYGKADGATYWHADHNSNKRWSHESSEFADVIMGSGFSITHYDDLKREKGGWISVSLTPELIYALVAGKSDGLAIMEGGTILYFNNFIHTVQSRKFAPYIMVELGKALTKAPAKPSVTAKPDTKMAAVKTGAIKVTIKTAADTFCWKVKLNGKDVPMWQVPFPHAVQASGKEQEHIETGRGVQKGPVSFYLNGLKPNASYKLEVTAIGRGGLASKPVKLTCKASPIPGKPVTLGKISKPKGKAGLLALGKDAKLWVVPGLVKIDPLTSQVMNKDMPAKGNANSVWNGKTIGLHGAKGETLSFQLVIERNNENTALGQITIIPQGLKGAGEIGVKNIALFKNWISKNKSGKWQPAYQIPIENNTALTIPDAKRKLAKQMNQTVYVDLHIPKTAKAGVYKGSIQVKAGDASVSLPIKINVHNFTLPDTLSFWVELNTYNVPKELLAFHQLTHQNRLVFNPWVPRPKLSGKGEGRKVDWKRYDKQVGSILSGAAFKNNHRAGIPTPCMYLPFADSWPTPLSPDNYAYKGNWVKRGGKKQDLVNHTLTSPYIGKALSKEYKDAFLSVQKQFVEHFKTKGWNKTEMQCFYGGKKTHRIEWGANMWWTTDEPYHWDDWLGLQFFCNLWT